MSIIIFTTADILVSYRGKVDRNACYCVLHFDSMNLSLVIILVAAAYILFVVLRFRALVQKGKVLVRYSHPFERRIPGGRPRILVMGDSTAVGTGVADPAGSVAGCFGRDFPQADIQNLGVNGMRAAELVHHFPHAADKSFDLVLLQIGANDIIRGTGIDDFKNSITRIFEKATLLGLRVVALHSGNVGLAPLFPWPLNRTLRARTLKIRDVYKKKAAEHGVTYVDLFEEKANDPFRDHAVFYAADKLHLTEAGYSFWYQKIRSAMQHTGIVL